MDENKILAKIEDDTRSKKMIWKHTTRDTHPNVEIVGLSYIASFVDDLIRVYRYKIKTWDNDILYKLEIIDNQGNEKFTFHTNRKIDDIYETIKFRTEDIENSMEKFLAG